MRASKLSALVIATALLTVALQTAAVDVKEHGSESLQSYSGVVLVVHGLSCPLCAHNLDGQLLKIDGVEKATIDLQEGSVDVRFADGHSVTRKLLEKAVEDSGFTLKNIAPKEES